MPVSAYLVLDDQRIYEQLSQMSTSDRNALLRECAKINATCRVDYNRIQNHVTTRLWKIPIYIDVGGADHATFLQAFFTATIHEKLAGRSINISWDTDQHRRRWKHPDHRKSISR